MKKITALFITSILLLAGISGFAAEKIIIGATPNPHVIVLEYIKEDLKNLGYELEIQTFTDYFLPNPATAAGELQANYFQHVPFLNDYNKSVKDGEKLFAAIPVHYEPFGLYAGKKVSLADIKEGDTIAVTNDPANEVRGLLLLQELGLIKLREGIDANTSGVTKEDIVENKKGIVVQEMNAELITAVLNDVDFAVINGNYALNAGLKPATDALKLESSEGETVKIYANYIVVKEQDKDVDFVKALKTVLHSKKVYDFLLKNEQFNGGVIPAFEIKE